MREPLRWEFPGGKVEDGESDAEALTREIHEELGLTIAVGPKIEDSKAGRVHLHLYDCRWHKGVIHLAEHAQFQWLTASDLPHYDWAPADIPLLPALIRHYKGRIEP